jgi:2-isopropylmalate synthase
VHVRVGLRDGEERIEADASGNGPISAFLAVLGAEGVDVKLRDYVEHTLAASGDSQAAAYVELEVDGRVLWGVGIDADISTASLKAVVSAVNRAIRGTVAAEKLREVVAV